MATYWLGLLRIKQKKFLIYFSTLIPLLPILSSSLVSVSETSTITGFFGFACVMSTISATWKFFTTETHSFKLCL
jgi:hypothetical protein